MATEIDQAGDRARSNSQHHSGDDNDIIPIAPSQDSLVDHEGDEVVDDDDLSDGDPDTEDNMGDIAIELEAQQTGNEDAHNEPGAQRPRFIELTGRDGLRRLFQIIGGGGGGPAHTGELNTGNDSDDDDFGLGFFQRRHLRRRRPPQDPNRFPKVPSDEGRALMESGVFGLNDVYANTHKVGKDLAHRKKLARRILDRELGLMSPTCRRANQKLMAQDMLPSTNADMIVHYDQPCYSGQFSEDGNFFFSVNKDFRVRMYDTSNPWNWQYYKTVGFPRGQWTLTDATLSPDNRYLAYTSISPNVALAPTDPNDLGDPYTLDLSCRNRRDSNGYAGYDRFGIWSIRFSGDGRQLVAGTVKGAIVVYDIESRRTLHRIFGHTDDVNAVCFADASSPHLLYSGSDDTFVKVWDTRSMGDSREAGAFVGHIEGITYIDSKGDGRYVLSNGKDQSMKLWDLRKVMSAKDFGGIKQDERTRDPSFDYRWGDFDDNSWYKDPNDNSVVTFRGHRVLRTLIRCHFSPPGSTNSRYVYSGSADGKVYIWNMDATIAGVVDVYAATKNSRPLDAQFDLMGGWGEDDDEAGPTNWKTCVRDASWHPNVPMIAASALNGYGSSTGTVTTHSWNDSADGDEAEPKMGIRLDKKLEADASFYRTGSSSIEPIPPRRFFGAL